MLYIEHTNQFHYMWSMEYRPLQYNVVIGRVDLSLCEQALSLIQHIEEAENASDHLEELGSSDHREFFAMKCEARLLLADIFRKLGQKNEAAKLLKGMKTFLMNISNQISSGSMSKKKLEFVKVSRCIWSWLARVLVMLDDVELSIIWLKKSLVAFFSVALPDFLSFYEEFLPMLQAITTSKSSTPDESRSPFQQAVN